jgi:hypothetical protein
MNGSKLLALGSLLVVPAASAQPVALDTFGPGNTWGSSFLAVRGSLAVPTPRNAQATLFTAQASGAVETITTVLRHIDGTNDYTLQLRTGTVNQVGAVLGSWEVMAGSSGQPIVTIPVFGGVMLNEGQTYYIAAIGHIDAEGAWHQNNQNMTTNGYAVSSNEGFTWFLVNGAQLPAVRITLEDPSFCYANCDMSHQPPTLNVEDFVCFISQFAEGIALPASQQINHYANCDGSTTEPVLNVEDFICFVDAFSQGCP